MVKTQSTNTKRQRFRNWRKSRPFWGAILALLSGLVILYVPLSLIEIAALPGTTLFIGFFLGGMVLLGGIMTLIMPQFAVFFGLFIMVSAILSIMGAMGGLVIGTLLGIIGGAKILAWRPYPKARKQKKQTNEAEDQIAAGQNMVIHKLKR
ncbi:hypothetical protein CYL18_08560 [Pradoshia eiseniae]|uniref:Uncharacterized protein n=1 Tax=Pradoshia eiseniae TaxID=2064768 RepID=A0A2S7MZS1_9BACI|nr:DUF6114 domain-containing protein [Pradoshia eiseniae]PQD95332.1 hypothetical protein CYL18_08560 [Pradoshia eiseniae]